MTDTAIIEKNAVLFERFEKSYWNYFLELEEQLLATKRYVAFEKANFKTYSSEYLKLLEAVCSEIDVVGKEIAHQIDHNFIRSDVKSNIQKWWFTIQDWYRDTPILQVSMLDEFTLEPWKNYRIEQYRNQNSAMRLRLVSGSNTPDWWTSYNRVKHNRTLDDPSTSGQYFQRANLGNLCNAFAALYILEKKYQMSVGNAEEYNRVVPSQLFEKRKPRFYYDENGDICEVED